MYLWFWMGVMYIGIMLWQDVMHKRMVDSRHNYFMTGYTVALGWIYHHVWWYILTVLLVAMGLQLYFSMLAAGRLGAVDAHTLGWVLIGLSLINMYDTAVFLAAIVVLTIIYTSAVKVAQKKGWYLEQKAAFYPVLFCAFLITGFITGIWRMT